jgi:NAD(P)-dependent dehydrogenase (short-subunit alcohol dehydrogenase family)
VLTDVAEEVEKTGRRALVVPTDITDAASADALADAAVTAFGQVDVLVNNAFAAPALGDMVDLDMDAIRAGFETDVYAALRLTKLFAPSLISRQGSVVMVSSVAVRTSRPTFGAYKMSKTSVIALAQTLSAELGPRGVRVNTVVPGSIWADALKGYFAYLAQERGVPAQQVYDDTAARLDLRRLPEPDDVANAVVFLASDLARAITGQCLDVNGGEFHR